jgi:FKBP-type peptidyl-prolyl cis-trans isomerase 2
MSQATHGDTVKVHYTGTLKDGTVFDSSLNRQPLQFIIGQGQTIRGIEQAIVGMSPGECKTVEIAASEAYGPYLQEAVRQIDRYDLPAGLDPKVGRQLQGQHQDGRVLIATITHVSETMVVLDGNHPLAGEDLVFDIVLVEIVQT